MGDFYDHRGRGHRRQTSDGSDLFYTDKPISSYPERSILPTTAARASRPGRPARLPRESFKQKITTWWGALSRAGKIAYLAILAIALLALILGLALGITLGKPHEDSDPASDYVPASISGDRASLLAPGYWYTAPENGTNFNWTSANPQLGNYRADSRGVDIVINTSQQYQKIDGFGGAMTDSSAFLLARLKSKESSLYDRLMDFVFNNATGVGVTRVSMGASDFSVGKEYSYIPSPPDFAAAVSQLNDPDSLLSSFEVDGTQSAQYTIPVLLDAFKRNPRLKVILSPWSPPAFMKSNNTMNGGTLRSDFVDLVAQYYAQTASAWASAGVKPWAMTVQNEPSHLAAYPSMGLNATQQVQIASALKQELARRGLGDVQVWAHDDNYSGWQTAADIVNGNASAVDAIAFHCYRGNAQQISQFEGALQNGVRKPTHMTECTGTGGPDDRWSGIQGWLGNVYWPVSLQNSSSVVQWNLALDNGFGPHLKSSYCTSCTGSLTLSSQAHPANPYVEYNDQLYLTSHFSAASTDLSGVGGGQAVRVAADQGRLYSLKREDWQCLNWIAYGAPLNGAQLQQASTANGAQPERRVGLVMANTCGETKNVVVSSDGRRTTLPVKQGLTSFVWTAP